MKVKGSVCCFRRATISGKRGRTSASHRQRGAIPREPFAETVPWTPHEKIHEIYQLADVVLSVALARHPSAGGFRSDGLRIAIMDRISAHTRTGRDGATGFLVPPGDVPF